MLTSCLNGKLVSKSISWQGVFLREKKASLLNQAHEKTDENQVTVCSTFFTFDCFGKQAHILARRFSKVKKASLLNQAHEKTDGNQVTVCSTFFTFDCFAKVQDLPIGKRNKLFF